MAQKTIPQLEKTEELANSASFPVDSGTQTYRIEFQDLVDEVLRLAEESGKGGTPPGGIIAYGGTVAPTGWLMCDGASYLRDDYPRLFAAIGTAHGSADSTHFNVPDLRGRFIRGVDGGVDRDPDKSGRTAMNSGGNTGDAVGSVQADQLKSHLHQAFATNESGGNGTNLRGTGGTLGSAGTLAVGNILASGGNETRPLNAYENFIIKT